jgi:adenosine deaminase
VRLYYDLGARVTVNTDNRLMTDTTVSQELHLCHTKMGFSLADIKQVIMNGFKSAFMPFHQKRQFLEKIGAELAQVPDVPPEGVAQLEAIEAASSSAANA